MVHRRVQTALVLGLVILSLLGQFLPAHAAETLTISPTRAQEENSPGVTLTLTVTGAMVGFIYAYTWSVVDPSGTNKTSLSSTVATSSTFTVNKVYPAATDFGGGAAIKYVGQYAVAVLRTSPSFGLAATGHFDIGLTNKVFYQRTEPVSIKATYNANDNVTVRITRAGLPAPGFPKYVSADPSGNFVFTWLTVPSTLTGNYTVSLSSTTTPKNPADSQWFIINRASLGVLQVSMVSSSLQKSETARFTFTATYPNSSAVRSGSATLTVTDPDGTPSSATASYDSTIGTFVANYRVTLNSKSGTWTGILGVNSLDDGFGNTGPTTAQFTNFDVQPAILTLAVRVPNGTRTSGDILAISATVTAPDGTSFIQGNVTAQFFAAGRSVGSLIRLLYDQSKGAWVGSYTIASSDPSGVWVLQVTASDSYGNSGQGSTSTLVSAPQSPLTSFWFLSVLGAIAVGALIGFLFLKRKRILRRQLHVDLTAVGLEANRVMDQDFFKSIQEQLGRKKEDSGEPVDG